MTTKSKTTEKPYVRYVRISKLNGRQKGDSVSFDEQDAVTTRIADTFGLPTWPEVVSDEDVSGMTFERPGWQRAVALVEEGKAGGIIGFDMKRISRGKTAEVLLMVEDVESAGGRLYDSSGRISMADADAELITTLKAMINRKDTREKAEYLASSARSAIKRGAHLAAPYGYAKVPVGKGAKAKPLVLNEAEAAQVKRAFELRAGGATWATIAAALNASGAAPRPHKRHGVTRQPVWTHKAVLQIVGREVYLGTAFNGSHRHPGAHPAIVTPELYARANRTKGTKPLGPSEGYMLSGLVRCAGCGYVMAHQAVRDHRYYRCKPSQHGAGLCPAPVCVPAGELEAWVAGRFKERYLGATWEADEADATTAEAETALDGAKAKLKVAFALKVELGESPSVAELELVDEQIAEARAGLREAEDVLAQARMQARGADLPAHLDEELFDSSPVPEQRHWLSLGFRTVVVRRPRRYREPAGDRARIVYADDAPADSTSLIAYAAALAW